MFNWLRYSGACVIIKLNPLHWHLVPYGHRDVSDLPGPNEQTFVLGWLCLTVRFWIDNGDW